MIGKLLRYVTGHPVQAQSLWSGTGAGEILFNSWDDGNWDNWEGGIWVQDYAIGDSFSFNMQFDYTGSIWLKTWMGYVDWRDRDGNERGGREASLGSKQKGLFAKVSEALCASLDAQASDGLSCTASPRATVNAFMRNGFQRLADNAFWVLGSAAAGGAAGGPVGFLAGLGFGGAGVIADGYLAEFNRYGPLRRRRIALERWDSDG